MNIGGETFVKVSMMKYAYFIDTTLDHIRRETCGRRFLFRGAQSRRPRVELAVAEGIDETVEVVTAGRQGKLVLFSKPVKISFTAVKYGLSGLFSAEVASQIMMPPKLALQKYASIMFAISSG